jgi:hypothetical protein
VVRDLDAQVIVEPLDPIRARWLPAWRWLFLRLRGLPAAVRDDREALLASGVGIAGINERVRELGGEMTIQSTDGTTLRVMLPVERGDVQGD